MSPAPNPKLGFLCAIGAFLIWGFFPLYVKQFQGIIEPLDIVAHRIYWSFVLLAGWFAWKRMSRREPVVATEEVGPSRTALVAAGAVAAALIAVNWLTYVWAVNNGRTLDASLGYYICPQVIVLLSVFVLGEKLSGLQWLAVGLATIGVLAMMLSAASTPWVGILLAFAFALYGLAKKKTSLSATGGLLLETGILVLPALGMVAWRASHGSAIFGSSLWVNSLLVLSGVATVAPLWLYAIALKHLPFSTVGLLQFLGPTIQFLLGAFLFGEAFDRNRIVGFSFVWLGVAVFLVTLFQSASKPDSDSAGPAPVSRDA